MFCKNLDDNMKSNNLIYINVPCKCPFCGKNYTISVPEDEYIKGRDRFASGAMIQDAFPTFTPSQREALLTGICDDCWNNM